MIAGPNGFVTELSKLGHDVTDHGGGRISFPYEVPIGPHQSETVTIGLAVPADYPMSCPSGPFLNPRVLPLNPDGALGHPMGAVHPAPDFGEDWEYLSRPYPSWRPGVGAVRAYLAHIANLFSTIP